MSCIICLENIESYFKCRNCVCTICPDCHEKLTNIICVMCRRPSDYLYIESIGDTFNKSRDKIIKAEQLIFAQFTAIKKQSKGLPYKLNHFISYSKECIYNEVNIDYKHGPPPRGADVVQGCRHAGSLCHKVFFSKSFSP